MNPLASIIEQHALLTQWTKKLDLALSAHGLHFSEFLLMFHLYQAPQHTLNRIALAEKIGLSASGITRMLQPMEKIGLVEKSVNPRDARQSLVVLSAAGLKIYQDSLKTAQATAEQLLNAVSETV